MQKEYHERLDRINSDHQTTNQKYDLKRKALKDLESNMKQKNSKIETDYAVLVEKHKNLEI